VGEDGKLNFQAHELLPGETLHIVIPCIVDTLEGVFSNEAALTSVNGLTKDIHSDKTYHEVKKYDVAFGKKILDTDTFLSGASLALLDASGTVVDSWMSGAEYHSVRIPAGDYTLQEREAPRYYAEATPIKFNLSRDGDITLRKQTDICQTVSLTCSTNTWLSIRSLRTMCQARRPI
jgi:hypothetical protein